MLMTPSLQHRCFQHRIPADEEGIALITALLIMLLSTVVVAGVLGLAIHTAQRSGLTRNKTAALNAAEAGIQAELSLISDGSCPATASADTPLPSQALPTASYIIHASPAGPNCTVNGSAVISATGYVPNATNPVTSTTMVAHINRSAGAPTSSGGYDFPDALFTDGSLTSGTLSLYGTGGSIPSITADGPIAIGGSGNTGSLLGGGINGESTVNVGASQIGGAVTGTTVTLTGPSSANPLTVQGSVGAVSSLTKTNTTVNGTVTSSGAALPQARPLGAFSYSQSAIQAALGVAAPATSCPANQSGWTSNFYYMGSCALGYAPTSYNPATSNGITVIVVQGPFSINIPQTAVGGQLYVVDTGSPGSDALTITGSGSSLPVFAYTDGSLNLSGNVTGQMAAHSITVAGGTTMTFSPPAAAMPNIAFTLGYFAPTGLASGTNPYISTVSSEYQCPGTTAC
jgi:Tfp pilus assembly protein PilX